MRVRINIGLDFDGIHTFEWEPSEQSASLEVPRPTLERWAAERESFKAAYGRWKRVAEEVDELLYRAEQKRAQPQTREQVVVAASAVTKKSPASPHR